MLEHTVVGTQIANERKLSYGAAINEALTQAMEADPCVFVYGIGVDDHKGAFGSTVGLKERFGAERVFDTPLAENAMTGVAIGAALNGMKPVHVHIRADFMFLAMDPLFNIAAKMRYMYGGAVNVPIVIKTTVGRSWGQGAQHSQSIQAILSHIPGVKVVMPATPYDAKGLMLAAIADPNPVVFIEHRMLYYMESYVPKNAYTIPIGEAVVRKTGSDITLVSDSYMVIEALEAAKFLETVGIGVEVIDLRTIVPLDMQTVVRSLDKTRRLLVTDVGHRNSGLAESIVAKACLHMGSINHSIDKIAVLSFPDCPTPTAKALEDAFYPSVRDVVEKCYNMLGFQTYDRSYPSVSPAREIITNFKGPF
jgi:pyruvate dehydrogenase E1 component beta subunit